MTRLALLCCLVACSGSKDDDGEIGGHCYPNATCNVGLSCVGGLCVIADAAVDAPVDVAIDARPDAFVCPNDPNEPNNSLAMALATSIDTVALTKTYNTNACPPSDSDYYAVQISIANRNLEVLVDETANEPVQASILNSGGVAIANAAPISGMPLRLRAYTPNLPTGVYYPVVYAPATMAGGRLYTLTLTVSGP